MLTNTSSKSSRRKTDNDAMLASIGQLPPQAVEVETVVLGALMIDADAFTVVSEVLHPETFYDPRHQKIYSAILSLNLAEKPVDMMTVCEQLRQDGTYDQVGGTAYIVELTNTVASSANIEYHAHILVQKYVARQLISFASGVATRALDEGQDIDELMQATEGELFELSQKNMKQDYVQIDSIVAQARLIIEKAASNTTGITGLSTGYTEMDKVTSGWQESDLIIIAGRPAMGKTSFALSLAKNIAIDNREPVAFFSLEMTNVQLVNRLISNVCSVPGSKIMNGQLSQDEWARFDNNIGRMQGAPLFIDDTPGLSVFELRTKARRLVKEQHVKLIMIDYLQLMTASGIKTNSRQEEVSTISRSLKSLAKELNIPIIALSQLSRAVEQRQGPSGSATNRPQLSDLRESGAIEQDADMVLFVHRPEYYGITEDHEGNSLKGMAQIIIAKHRKGATKDVTLSFKGEYTRFANPDEYDPYAVSDSGSIRSSSLNTSFSPDDDPLSGGRISNDDVPY